MDSQTVAALYVLPDGPYAGLEGVEVWDEARDARTYPGPHPVVAHPPCARWGRYWSGGPSAKVKRRLGDDGGCFAAALLAVWRWGGVLEHPEASHAFLWHGLPNPYRDGLWQATICGGWVCCVEQGHYGHQARKATWLAARGPQGWTPPELIWGSSTAGMRLDQGYHSREERARAVRTGACQRLSQRQRLSTPPAFRDVLLAIARSCRMSQHP